ncbi:MAG TPA: hypothetical protein VEK57_31795 [Thermoanaerobaculia bacterium]|nr:hypothetical protein [Thermoanaerobaculia bacterium]
MSRLLLTSAFALLLMVPAFAQTPEVSTLPVDEPLDVGGTILQPGVYTIRVVPTLGDRNRVQITSPDLSTIYATLLTVPHDLEPNEEIPNTRLVFFPAGEGQPRALRTWFPPNTAMNAGHDIVYEASRASQLARLASAPVVTYRGELADNTELQVVTPAETFEPYRAPAPAMTSAAVEMPNTAGKVPLLALFGLLSLAAAAVVRFAR